MTDAHDRALSAAEYEVLLQSSRSPVHRHHSAELSSLAALPALETEPGSPDHITDSERRAAFQAPSMPLTQVLENRRSRTDALHPLDRADLAAVLARSFRIVADGVDDNGAPWSLRTVPSAGASHPFDLLVTATDVRGLRRGHYVYGPNAISLLRLKARQQPYADLLSAAVTSASRRLEPAPVSLCLVANVERTAQRYLTTLTLLLRDAGALLATLHLVATDLGLRSSIVGTAGHFEHRETVSATVVDCGGLVLGRA
jgi:SagB-type dehydrogenase family enzyme